MPAGRSRFLARARRAPRRRRGGGGRGRPRHEARARRATPAPTPIDLAGLASYPPVASTPPDESVTLTGAGDIASCSLPDDEATAALLEDVPGWVFTAGDNAYESGTTEEFEQCYDPSWGAYRERTFPAIGNHDAVTPGRQGYFDYFGSRAGDPRAGWYATTLGAWRLIVLDSNCVDAGGCGPDTDQGRWLAAELDANPSDCTLAIWHHPRFSTGYHGPTLAVQPFWDALYAAGAELVVNGARPRLRAVRPRSTRTGNPTRNAGSASSWRAPAARRCARSRRRTRTARCAMHPRTACSGLTCALAPTTGSSSRCRAASFTDRGSGTCH